MKVNFKRLLAMTLAIVMIVGMMPLNVLATEPGDDGTVAQGSVAQVNGVGYATLAEAITAAAAGDTITLVADIEENVTIDKKLTIDGAEFNYTGTMTLTSGNVTVENINFVKGQIAKTNKTIIVTVTIKNCDFDGQGLNAYALNLRYVNNIVIEDCTATNYGYGFLQIPKSNDKLIVKNVTISDVTYGIKVDYSNGITLENVTVTDAGQYGLYNSNHGKKTITIKDCDLSGITTWKRNETVQTTYVFEGENEVETFDIYSSVDNLKLADADAALTTSTELTITPADETVKSVYVNGTYKLVDVNAVALIGNQGYETLTAAISAAVAGDTITLVADITEDVTVNKKVTIDGAQFTYTGKMNLTANTTIKNVNFDGKGSNIYAVETRGAATVVITDCTVKDYGYGFLQVVSSNDKLTVKNVTVSDVNYGIKIDRSNTVTLENVTVTDARYYGLWNSNYGGKTITIKNCNFSSVDTWKRNDTTKTTYVFEGENSVDTFGIVSGLDTLKLAATATLTAPEGQNVVTDVAESVVVYEDGAYRVISAAAKIGGVYYETLAAAYEAAQDGNVIVLLADVTLAEMVKIEKAITLDLNGKTVSTDAQKAFEIYANAEIKNGTIVAGQRCVDTRTAVELTLTDVKLEANSQPLTIGGFDNGTKVTMTNVNINAGGGYGIITFVQTNLTADNTTISGYSALYVKPGSEGSKFTFTGSTLSGNIGTNDVEDNSFATIAVRTDNVTVTADAATTVESVGEYHSAISVYTTYDGDKTAAGANITVAGTIKGEILDADEVLGDNVIAVNAAYADALKNCGFPSKASDEEGLIIAVAPAAKIGKAGYATLTAAIADAKAGDTITLVADITENVTVNKKVTIDGAQFTYTGKMNLTANTTIKNVNFDGKGSNIYAVETRNAATVVITDCTVKDYGYGFLQVVSSNDKLTVKNVTVTNVKYGIKIDRSNGATLENVTVDASANGLWNSNYSAKTITIKNCNFSSVDTWQRNDTTKTTYVFQGNNTVNAFGINSSLDTLKLGDADATLTAPEGLNVTTDVAGKDVFYKDGVYFVVNNLEGSGTEADPFKIANIDDLIKFRNSVNKGETKYNAEGVYVELVADIDLASIENWEPIGTFDYSFDGNFDGNGHKIMNLKMSDSTAANGEAYLGFFGVTANNTIENFVIENVTIKSNGQIVAAAIAYPYYTTVNNITVCGDIAIEGGNYTAGVLAYTRLCENASNLTVSGNEGSYITGAQVVGGVIADLQMNNGLVADYSDFSVSGVTITGTKNVGGICGIIGVQTLNGATVQNVALVSNDSRVGTVAGSVGTVATISDVVVENVTGATAVIGGAYTNGAAVEAKTGDVYYTTFAAAAKAANGETITLLAPVVITKDTTLSDLTVDGNGVYPAFRVANGATLTVENCNIYNATDYVFTLGASDKTTAGNVVIKSGSYKGQTTVASVTMGTLTINGGEFSVFDSEYGATYLLNCYDANYKNGSAQIVVNGGSFVGFNPANNAAEGAGTSFVADGKCVKDVNGTFFVGNHVVTKVYTEATKEADAFTTYDCEHCGYHEVVTHEGTKVLPVAKIGNVEYYSLQEAVDAADPSNTNVTITLLRDAEGAGVVIPEGKFSERFLLIDFAGHTYTLTEPVGSTGTESNGFQILKSNKVNLRGGTLNVAEEAADEFYILVQNYADLTVRAMVLDGTNLDKYASTDGDSYTLSNNSGKVTINEGSKIIANKDGDKAFAFDVCDFGSYDLPYVTVTSNVVIEGAIEAAAKIGSVYYATFAHAAQKVEAGKTIVLLAPVVITEDTTLSGLTVDGNGVYPAFRVTNNATLTVENCNIYNATDYVFTLGASDKSTAGNVVINSGSYKGQTTVASVTKGTLTINGGEFSVYEGEYGATYLLNCYDANVANGTAKIVVKGGTFVGFNPADNAAEGADTNFVAEGYIAEDNGNGSWTVVAEKLLKITSSNIVLGNELAMYFYMNKADLDGTDYVAVVTKTYADGRDDVVVEVPFGEWEDAPNNSSRVRFKFNGIAAKEMGDDIHVYIKNADGKVLSETYTDSIQKYVERGFATGKATGELATLLVDMLNYGAAAQRMFTYNVDHPANENMDAYQNMATPTVTLENKQVKGEGFKSMSLVLESNISMVMFFDKAVVNTDMTAVVTFTDHYGKDHVIEVAGSDFEDRGSKGWAVVISGLVVADGCELVTCKFVNADGTEVEGVYGIDSMESMCARAVAGGGGSYYEDIMKFSIAAYNYFH